MDITLYYAPNTCALVPYVTLTEAGAPFRTHALNFRARQQMSADYLQLNPKHKVPLLVVDGKPLSENPAIQLWIANAIPQAGLLPTDSWELAQAMSVMSWCSSGIHPHLSRINSPSKSCAFPGSEESVLQIAHTDARESFELADRMLTGKTWLFGSFTAADAHLFWCLRRAGQLGVDLSTFRACSDFFARMSDRPSVRKLVAFEQEVQRSFAA